MASDDATIITQGEDEEEEKETDLSLSSSGDAGSDDLLGPRANDDESPVKQLAVVGVDDLAEMMVLMLRVRDQMLGEGCPNVDCTTARLVLSEQVDRLQMIVESVQAEFSDRKAKEEALETRLAFHEREKVDLKKDITDLKKDVTDLKKDIAVLKTARDKEMRKIVMELLGELSTEKMAELDKNCAP